MGKAALRAAMRINARNRANPGIGVAFNVMWLRLENASIDVLILFSPGLPHLQDPV
jgi:hypothetical protein